MRLSALCVSESTRTDVLCMQISIHLCSRACAPRPSEGTRIPTMVFGRCDNAPFTRATTRRRLPRARPSQPPRAGPPSLLALWAGRPAAPTTTGWRWPTPHRDGGRRQGRGTPCPQPTPDPRTPPSRCLAQSALVRRGRRRPPGAAVGLLRTHLDRRHRGRGARRVGRAAGRGRCHRRRRTRRAADLHMPARPRIDASAMPHDQSASPVIVQRAQRRLLRERIALPGDRLSLPVS